MDTEHRLNDDMTRAMHARELLDNPVLQEALSAMEREVIEQWEHCPARDKDGKEALWQLFKMGKKFEALLKGYVESGKLASANLHHYEQTRIERVAQFLKRA